MVCVLSHAISHYYISPFWNMCAWLLMLSNKFVREIEKHLKFKRLSDPVARYEYFLDDLVYCMKIKYYSVVQSNDADDIFKHCREFNFRAINAQKDMFGVQFLPEHEDIKETAKSRATKELDDIDSITVEYN